MGKTHTFSEYKILTSTGTLINDRSFSRSNRQYEHIAEFKNCPGNCQQILLEEISISANKAFFSKTGIRYSHLKQSSQFPNIW